VARLGLSDLSQKAQQESRATWFIRLFGELDVERFQQGLSGWLSQDQLHFFSQPACDRIGIPQPILDFVEIRRIELHRQLAPEVFEESRQFSAFDLAELDSHLQ